MKLFSRLHKRYPVPHIPEPPPVPPHGEQEQRKDNNISELYQMLAESDSELARTPEVQALIDERMTPHCCGTCALYNPGQVDSENFGRCKQLYVLDIHYAASASKTLICSDGDVCIGLTPEDGQDCKAWRRDVNDTKTDS